MPFYNLNLKRNPAASALVKTSKCSIRFVFGFLAGALFTAQAFASPILDVSGNADEAYVIRGNQGVGSLFRVTDSFNNVAIDLDYVCLGCGGAVSGFYLLSADINSTTVRDRDFAPFSGLTGSRVFSGLDLTPGDYYLIMALQEDLDPQSPALGAWTRSYDPAEFALSGIEDMLDWTISANFFFGLPQITDLNVLFSGSEHPDTGLLYSITSSEPSTPVPAPAPLLLVLSGLLLIELRRRAY